MDDDDDADADDGDGGDDDDDDEEEEDGGETHSWHVSFQGSELYSVSPVHGMFYFERMNFIREDPVMACFVFRGLTLVGATHSCHVLF